MKTHPYLDEAGTAIFAHRGGSIEAPENTIEAFQHAVGMGCGYVATDVQLSKDGIPYTFHDNDLLRITGIAKDFGDLDSAEIDALRIFGDYPIPTLKECLQRFPDTKFNIDLKTDAVMKPALDIIKELNAMHRVCITSFSHKRIAYAREYLPEVCLSMAPQEMIRLKLKTWGLPLGVGHGHCIQVPIYYKNALKIVTRRFVKKVQALGLKIHVWTINDEHTMQKLIDMGVDGIMTDRPRALKEILP